MGKSAEAYDENRMKNVGMQRQQQETEGVMKKYEMLEVEVDWDRDGRIENMRVYVKDSKEDLIDLLSEEVLDDLEAEAYRTGRDDCDQDDPREER